MARPAAGLARLGALLMLVLLALILLPPGAQGEIAQPKPTPVVGQTGQAGTKAKNGDSVAIPSRYEYKMAMKFPLYYYDVRHLIPFWKTHGMILRAQDYIRLVPSVPHQRGSLWTMEKNSMAAWRLTSSFLVTGRGYAGGEGLTFWYSNNTNGLGPFYGAPNAFQGLAVVLDTADVASRRYSPYIYGVQSRGDAATTSAMLATTPKLGGCFRQYRNTLHPVWFRMSYVNRTLTVEMDVTHRGKLWVECFTARDLDLPTGLQFGVSAATEPLYHDNVDVYSMEVEQLQPPPRPHGLRGEEAAYLQRGQPFVMTPRLRQAIQESEAMARRLREAQHAALEPDEVVPTAEILEQFREGQDHILDGITLLSSHFMRPSDSGAVTAGAAEACEATAERAAERAAEAAASRLETRLEAILRKVEKVEEDVRNWFYHVQSGNRQAESVYSELKADVGAARATIADSHETLHKTLRDQNRLGYLSFGLAFSIGMLVCLCVAAFLRSRNSQPKKFL